MTQYGKHVKDPESLDKSVSDEELVASLFKKNGIDAWRIGGTPRMNRVTGDVAFLLPPAEGFAMEMQISPSKNGNLNLSLTGHKPKEFVGLIGVKSSNLYYLLGNETISPKFYGIVSKEILDPILMLDGVHGFIRQSWGWVIEPFAFKLLAGCVHDDSLAGVIMKFSLKLRDSVGLRLLREANRNIQ